MPLPYLAGEDSASSHSAVLQAATRRSTEIRRLALSLALPYQPVGRPQADTCRCHQLKRAPRATAVAALVPQSVANRSASKSDEARGVSGSAAAVLAAVSCRATAQAMENDSNPQTERHEGSSLAGAHSTAVSQQAQTAWSSVWEQRASAKDAEFVRRCCAECASGPGHPRPLPIGRLSGALRASASCEQNRHIGDATPKSFHQRRLAARSPSPRAREPSGGAPTPLYPTSEFREPPWLDGLALSRAYVFLCGRV